MVLTTRKTGDRPVRSISLPQEAAEQASATPKASRAMDE
jgi:hypothetical protein